MFESTTAGPVLWKNPGRVDNGRSPHLYRGDPRRVLYPGGTSAPVGFIKADPVNVQVTSEGEIQNILMKDDHTKLAFKKYTQDKDGQKLLPGAEFALYEAKRIQMECSL